MQQHLLELPRDTAVAHVSERADLLEDVGLASIEVMELIEALEDTFDLAFPLNELADVRTVADLARQLRAIAG